MLDRGGTCEMVSIRFFWSFVCDTSCIHIYFHALYYIHVIVRLMWHVCSLHWYICVCVCVCARARACVSCHLVMLICFASTFYSDSNELYFMYSCLIHIFWVHHVGLGRTSMSNSFVLIVKCLYEPSMLKTSLISSTYSRLCCHQSPKRRRLKASRPLVGFR